MTNLVDTTTREAVVAELEWDPQVNASRIAVSATHGTVVLSGHVPGYSDRWAAVSAAQRVYGVRVIADEIEVKLAESSKRDDADIAEEITRHMRASREIADTVKVEILKGHVTLRGEVTLSYQRDDAKRAIRHIRGVHGISNKITVRADRTPQLGDVEHRVRDAIARMADLDARSIRITLTDGTIHLHGQVRSFAEKRAAELAAARAPGVTYVDNAIVVSP